MPVPESSAAPTTADLLLARRAGDNPALLFADDAWTWREFVAECAARATALQKLRRPGPWHVGVLMDNDPEYLFLIGGAALCGATIVGVNPTRRGAELAADVTGTDCQTVFVGDRHRTLAADLPATVEQIFVGDDAYRDLLRATDRSVAQWVGAATSRHILLLLFTSGSTGAPKAVICSSERFAYLGMRNVRGVTAADVGYNAMPLFHGNALMSVWAPLLHVGGTLALRSRFSASGFLPDVQRFDATFFNYVGRSLSYIVARPESPEEADNSLRFGWGTEASARDREEFTRRFGTPVSESYGSSEGVCVIVRDETTPAGALGVPDPRLGMEVVDDTGRPCPAAVFDGNGRLVNGAEAIGEIVARGGAARFEGYYRNAEAMAAKVRDGDYWTGDLAYRDRDGVFWFAGRTSDWIRVDSENFATAPLERIVGRYPGIRGVAAYPVPDPRTGDRVMITVEHDADTDFDPAAFTSFLTAQPDMGTKWMPRLVRVTDRLPMTATRKLDKPALRRTAWNTRDDVFEYRDDGYRILDDARVAALVDEFAAHERAHLLP